MSVSVTQQLAAVEDPSSQRALFQLIGALQKDVAALKAFVDTHQHSALNAAPTTVSPTQNTSA